MIDAQSSGTPARVLVLDTNIVLDLYVYEDPASVPLREALANGQTAWLATVSMRDELARVLAYPQIGKRLASRDLAGAEVLARFDERACLVGAAPKAAYTCKDTDDQKFIDLAVAHRATLLSKDAEVLCMAKRLALLGVMVARGM
ncbi:MAG TPA: putative toxin-antitoxin system toxin component, PIN family [Hydrogenophaga sp.]